MLARRDKEPDCGGGGDFLFLFPGINMMSAHRLLKLSTHGGTLSFSFNQQVRLKCGLEWEMAYMEEDVVCIYATEMTTPAACDPELVGGYENVLLTFTGASGVKAVLQK